MLKKGFALLSLLLDLVYPPKCPGCRQEVASHGEWCATCLLRLLSVRKVELKGRRLEALEGCLAVCDYTAGLKRVIHDTKFRQVKQYGLQFTRLLEVSKVSEALPDFQLMVPVPLDKARLAARGVNQTELMFKTWATKEQFSWLDCLERTRPTHPQWELDSKTRRANLEGAFRLQAKYRTQVAGQDILLVDDIFTTGITMSECAQALKKARANRIYGLVLASGAK